MGAAIGRANTRKQFRECRRPDCRLLPSAAGAGPRVGGKRPPTAAAVAWWGYAKRCVLLTWRKDHGKVDLAEVARRARLQVLAARSTQLHSQLNSQPNSQLNSHLNSQLNSQLAMPAVPVPPPTG